MANILTNQDDFTNAAWVKFLQAVVNGDLATAPDGTTTGDQLIDNGSEGTGVASIYQIATVTDAVHVLSFCVKKDQLDYIRVFNANFDAGASDESYFNVANGTLVSKGTNHIDAGITASNDGWYQVWVTFQSSTQLTGTVGVSLSQNGTDTTIDLDGTSSQFIWRGQLELGSSPTTCAELTAAVTLGGGRVLTKGTMPKWWKEYEETQPKEKPPRVIAPKERIAALAGKLKMPKS